MKTKSLRSEVGIGATDELSLRVSVAALLRVLFEHPKEGKLMLALERKATLLEEDGQQLIDVKSQPFGGALQIIDLGALQERIGNFHFDSEESRAEQDFRIFIHLEDWDEVREFCLGQLSQADESILEADPTRELAEEFADTLKMSLKRDQYSYQVAGTVIEDYPSPTANTRARGYPTARMYGIFEIRILDPVLASALVKNSESCSDQNLQQLAWEDFQNGGAGRANAVLTLPLKEIDALYMSVPPEARNKPVWFQNHQLDETVASILEGVSVPKYRRL
jgi:hypothetical protein